MEPNTLAVTEKQHSYKNSNKAIIVVKIGIFESNTSSESTATTSKITSHQNVKIKSFAVRELETL